MGAGRRDTYQYIPVTDCPPRYFTSLFDYTDGKSREVVLAGGIKAGHFSGFTAEENAVGLFAAVNYALYHLFGHANLKLARGKIIEKKQRPGAAANKVVYVHGHKVNANGIVLV